MDNATESLTKPQAEFLRCIAAFTIPPSVGVVGRARGISAPWASDLVAQLVDRGLLRRIYDDNNRRVTLLELTESGRAVCFGRQA